MSNKNKIGVALTKELCPVCTKEMDGAILINKKLTEKEAEKVESLHGKVISWSKELCPECKKMKEQGFILIGAVEKKTKDTTNPYRSGNIWCVKQQVADALFSPHPAPQSGIAFIDINVAKQMELPDVNMNA